ncbi:alpha/beta fold hydrolase [Maribacter halichondriae]|uniref:alpha/beta fold hydrolase n=1 Tax=Maribacter halichondriae TaxID=2980554 RepID=UPI002358C87F|nr:alpha/beta hydrolase [Maribacter sp. Hal144]
MIRIKTRQIFPPKGSIIHVGDQNFHVNIEGNKTSLPTVIFESGYYPTGGSSLIWEKIQNEISEHTKTISYDRAGILGSEPSKNELTTDRILENFHGILKKVDGDGPYIIVAHSISGMSARAFTAQYPEMVCGLVLIDVTHPEAYEKIPKEILGNQSPRNLTWIKFLSFIGYLRLTNSYRYPATRANDSINIISNAFFPEKATSIAEEKNLKMEWSEKIKNNRFLGNLPIRIIYAGGEKVISGFPSRKQGELYNTIWEKLQQDMPTLSNDTELIEAKKSGHYIPLEQPDLVTKTILDLLRQIEDE